MTSVALQRFCVLFKVVLENAYTDPADQVSVRGVVRVLNMDFHKAVYIRWTLNEWRTMMDYKANYLMGSNDILTDKFTFKIYAPLDVGQSLVFAVRSVILDWGRSEKEREREEREILMIPTRRLKSLSMPTCS